MILKSLKTEELNLLLLNNIIILLNKKRLLISTAFFSLFFFITCSTFAQNLIPFGNFEGETHEVTHAWKQPSGEYFHYQLGGNQFIEPRSGNACNGVCLIGGAPTEYLQVKLSQPLVEGISYQLSFFVRGYSLRAINTHKLDSVGVLFRQGAKKIDTRTEIHENPQLKFVYNTSKAFSEWQQINYTYEAEGGESHLIIGRFYTLSETDNDHIGEIEGKLELLNDNFYESNKIRVNAKNDRLAVPGMKQSRRQRKNEQKEINEQMMLYRIYNTNKKGLENALINTYKKYKGIGEGQTYQVRLYFDDFCLTPPNDSCIEIAPYKTDVLPTTGFSTNIEVGDTIVLDNVYFDYDQATLLGESYSELNLLKDILNSRPSMEISIEGHTDDQGSVDYNLSLSSERAEAVKLYLEEVGIVETRLNYFGYGETKPKQTNQTEKGRASNRRVEIIILKP